MKTALSTACFFPLEPEKAFLKVSNLGFETAEVFLNTDYEVSSEYINELKALSESEGVKICAIHSPYGYAEPIIFFSPYIRRREESLAKYERIFENISVFGPVIFNFHGAHLKNCPLELGIEYYIKLNEIAKKYGVIFCQENVNKYLFSTPENIKALKDAYPDVNFTLDIKQANRAGFSPYEILDAMGENIRHFHINDFNGLSDCLLPGAGDFPLEDFTKKLKLKGFNGNAVIEVYRKNFKIEEEVITSRKFVEKL